MCADTFWRVCVSVCENAHTKQIWTEFQSIKLNFFFIKIAHICTRLPGIQTHARAITFTWRAQFGIKQDAIARFVTIFFWYISSNRNQFIRFDSLKCSIFNIRTPFFSLKDETVKEKKKNKNKILRNTCAVMIWRKQHFETYRKSISMKSINVSGINGIRCYGFSVQSTLRSCVCS